MVRRVIQGDLSSVRVVLGLVLIAIIFQVQEDRFLSAENLTNLMLQITTIGLISVGIVYVLLLGEIDLSVGAVSGLSGAVMAVLNVKHGWNPYLAIAAAVAVGAAIGFAPGLPVQPLRRSRRSSSPWPGSRLARSAAAVLGKTGSLNLNDPRSPALPTPSTRDTVGWIFAAVIDRRLRRGARDRATDSRRRRRARQRAARCRWSSASSISPWS